MTSPPVPEQNEVALKVPHLVDPARAPRHVDDELDEMNGLADRTRTLVRDMSDLDDPQLIKEFSGTTEASGHNLYIRGHFVYQSDDVEQLPVLRERRDRGIEHRAGPVPGEVPADAAGQRVSTA